MARWKLLNPHYLKVRIDGESTEWEQVEVNRDTQKQMRKRYKVPMFLDPNDIGDQNYKQEGELVICHEGKGLPKDYVFEGPPTPDMEPMDDEARAISDKESAKWIHPIESLPGQGFGQGLLDEFQKQIAAIISSNNGVVPTQPAVSLGEIQLAELALLKENNEKLMAAVAELMAEKAERQATPAAVERRV